MGPALAFLKGLRDTLFNRYVYLNLSGITLWISTFAMLARVAPERAGGLITFELLLGAYLLCVCLLVGSAYPVVTGRWNQVRWRVYNFWLYTVPAGISFALMAGLAGEFFYFGMLYGAGGLVASLGYTSGRATVGIGIVYCVLIAASLSLAHPEYVQANLFEILLVLAGLFWLALMFGYINNFIGDNLESIQRLLRTARRDKRTIAAERKKADGLLLNILPPSVAEELKEQGRAKPVLFENATVLFTDFQGFTKIAERLTPAELVGELDRCFSYFDSLMERYHLEKLKTIGDSFMCAGGLPVANATHAVDCVLAALEIQAFMNQMKAIKAEQGLPYWELRLGIHSGPLVAGVIGEKKFAYDVWGDTVNTASRCESSGQAGRINVSQTTHARVRDFFDCEYRGKVAAKNKGEIEMYFVHRIKPELARPGEPTVPGAEFRKLYQGLPESER